jgi:hypothetical protein
LTLTWSWTRSATLRIGPGGTRCVTLGNVRCIRAQARNTRAQNGLTMDAERGPRRPLQDSCPSVQSTVPIARATMLIGSVPKLQRPSQPRPPRPAGQPVQPRRSGRQRSIHRSRGTFRVAGVPLAGARPLRNLTPRRSALACRLRPAAFKSSLSAASAHPSATTVAAARAAATSLESALSNLESAVDKTC